jgi:hypothetical protein
MLLLFRYRDDDRPSSSGKTAHTPPFLPKNPKSSPHTLAHDSLTKIVNDEKHPYIPPGPDDIRGLCPGLNTLANHGVSAKI